MTLAEKIGQMTQPEHTGALENSSDIQSLFIGSILNGGGSKPSGANQPQAWASLYDKYQQQALKTRNEPLPFTLTPGPFASILLGKN